MDTEMTFTLSIRQFLLFIAELIHSDNFIHLHKPPYL